MDISAGLIAKALAGASAVAASVGVATNWDEISGFWGDVLTSSKESKILKEAGLKCETNAGCTLESGRKIKIKQGETTSEEITSLATSPGKIKLHGGVSDYEHNLKFVIEEGDISLSSGGITKLERDETYEIKKEGEDWILLRKSTTIEEINKKLNGLGFPSDCKLDNNASTNPMEKDCGALKDGKLKVINFDGKSSSIANNISNAENVTLKLKKTDDREVFPNGVKIIFEVTNKDVSIPKDSGNITLRKGTNPEFKIVDGKLKRAWDKNTIKKKIKLKCEENTDECTLEPGKKINIMNSDNSKKTGITALNLNASGKIKLHKNIQDYYQGFKFKVEGGNVSLTVGNKEGSGTEITELTKDSEYEMKFVENKWYLSKK